MRHEFIEALWRIAPVKYPGMGNGEDAFVALFQTHFRHRPSNCAMEEGGPMSVNLNIATTDVDDFRRERFYNEQVDLLLTKFQKELNHVYKYYAAINPQGGQATFDLQEFVKLVTDSGLLQLTSRRDCTICFVQARMRKIDDLKSRYVYDM